MSRRELILAGAGHAQLDLLVALTRTRLPNWAITLVVPQPDFQYSGMLPGIIAGRLAPADAAIPVAAIARAAGITVKLAAVTALDVARRSLALSDGAELRYDLLSLDVGSTAEGTDVPGAREHAFPMRPFHSALQLMERLDAAMQVRDERATIPVVVVGGGAAGVEIAMALRARIRAADRVPRVSLVDALAGDGLPLAGFSEASRRLAGSALSARDVEVVAGQVTRVDHDSVTISGDVGSRTLPSVATAWTSGAAPHPWLRASGLACDARGYPLAAATLALGSESAIFGGGDCITLRDAPATPKAGVYAVRMAPVLAANVVATALGNASLVSYTPQRHALALLSTGDGRALLRWRGIALESRWAEWLKGRIDRRYIERYRQIAR